MELRIIRVAFVLIIGSLIAAFVLMGVTNASDTVRVRIPVCQEDEPYLQGRGDFENGRWSRYVCVHQDAIERVDTKEAFYEGYYDNTRLGF